MKAGAVLGALQTLLYAILVVCSAAGVAPLRKLNRATAVPNTPSSCLPTRDGYLRARIRGAHDADIAWTDADMQCDGGPRPDDRGVRVTFAGRLPGNGQQIRLVFGIAAPAGSTTARNVPTNVTVILEDEQKLYSTAGEGKCTIDALAVQTLPLKQNRHWRRVVARGFCTLPVAAIAGTDALELDRFDFAGGLRDED